MCLPKAPNVNVPTPAALPALPPPLAPPEKTADQLVTNPDATNTASRRRASRGLTPDLDALRIPLNLPRSAASSDNNLP